MLSSLFYPLLAAHGADYCVKSWRALPASIFEMKLIFIPVNCHEHWSLCVVVNPNPKFFPPEDDGNVHDENRPTSYLLCFDSLPICAKSRSLKVAATVRSWLNCLWKLHHVDCSTGPFTRRTIRLHAPKGKIVTSHIHCLVCTTE